METKELEQQLILFIGTLIEGRRWIVPRTNIVEVEDLRDNSKVNPFFLTKD